MSPQEVVTVDGIHWGKSFDEAIITNGSKYKMSLLLEYLLQETKESGNG